MNQQSIKLRFTNIHTFAFGVEPKVTLQILPVRQILPPLFAYLFPLRLKESNRIASASLFTQLAALTKAPLMIMTRKTKEIHYSIPGCGVKSHHQYNANKNYCTPEFSHLPEYKCHRFCRSFQYSTAFALKPKASSSWHPPQYRDNFSRLHPVKPIVLST